MLKTASLNKLLAQNTSPDITSIFIFTPTGSLLSYASHLDLNALRTQATLASNIWAAYTSLSHDGTISSAAQSQSNGQGDPPPAGIKALTLELDRANLSIHTLRPALLLAVVGPLKEASLPQSPTITASSHQVPPRPTSLDSTIEDSRSDRSISETVLSEIDSRSHLTNGFGERSNEGAEQDRSGQTRVPSQPGSLSEPRSTSDKEVENEGEDKARADSLGQVDALASLRARAEAMATWLDEELGSFQMPSSRPNDNR